MPESFRFPGNWSPELFSPSNLPLKVDWNAPSFSIVGVIARLKPDLTLVRAKSDLVTINVRSDQAALPAFAHVRSGLQVQIETLHEHLVGERLRSHQFSQGQLL
jgi:hypothetical protein